MSKLIEFTDRATGLPVFVNPDRLIVCHVGAASGGGTDIEVIQSIDESERPMVVRYEVFETPKRVKAKLRTDPAGPLELALLALSCCIFLLAVAVL